jgi:hypothetical protein
MPETNAMMPASHTPWHREPWPWILMSGPFIVIVAGFVTLALAVGSSDGLVSDDYYKQGLAINRAIERDARARALGASASLQFDDARMHVRVSLAATVPPPDALRLVLAHPTRAGEDRAVTLHETSPGAYEATLDAPRQGNWHVRLSDAQGSWRLVGEWAAREARLDLAPAPR